MITVTEVAKKKFRETIEAVTLKQGVEKTLFEDVPQITKVMDVTDHAAGTNPYYQPSK